MRKRSFAGIALVVLMAASSAGVGAHLWALSHVRRWTGRPQLGFVGCDHCHGVDLAKMPWAKPRPHHPSPAGLAVSRDGRRLYIALDDVEEVVEAETAGGTIVRRARVAGRPYGLALGVGDDRLYVACRDGDRVAALDLGRFQEVASVPVGVAPVALAYSTTPAGGRLVIANSVSGDISVVATTPLREVTRLLAGREPFAVAGNTADGLVYVANRLAVSPRPSAVPASELTVVDPSRARVVARRVLDSAHLAEGVCAVTGRGWTLTPLVKVRNLLPITQVADGWVMSSGLAITDPQGEVTQVPLDEANDFFADPAGIAVDAAGRRAYVASGGSDVVSVVDLERLAAWLQRAGPETRRHAVEDLALSGEYVVARIPTGRNPRQLALSPDGTQLFVAERLADRVAVIDTRTLRPRESIVLGDGGMWDPIRRGERVFTTAAYTFQHQFSCRSCHPDGHVDGLSYDFDTSGLGDNFLDNRSLHGVAGTAPFKWNGKNPSLAVQCGPRFARVLMRTDPIPAPALNDLTTYIESLPPARTLHRPGAPLTAAEERGRETFFATARPDGRPIPRERQCPTCHRPPLYTNRLLSAVGTRGPRDSSDVFDTPQLLGIAASAPYLHDGRAATLEQLWTVYNTNDLHGVSSYMNKAQLNDLVEFLKTL